MPVFMRRAGIVHVRSGGDGFLPPDFHDEGDSLAIVHLRMTLESGTVSAAKEAGLERRVG